jgi:hypothetical protein
MNILIPKELLIKIFEYSDIDIRMHFKIKNKLNLNKYENINLILKENSKRFKVYYEINENDINKTIYFTYRYLHIKDSKYFRLTLIDQYDSIFNEFKVDIVNEEIPTYVQPISSLLT